MTAKDNIISSFLTSNYNGSIGHISGSNTAQYDSTGQFSYDMSESYFDDQYNMANIVYHENSHITNNHPQQGGGPVREESAIMASISHPSYQSTTYPYRENTAQYLFSQWQAQGKTGTFEQARDVCGCNW